MERILQRIVDGEGRMEDLELLESLFGRISGKVLCALAEGAVAPIVQRHQAVPRGLRRRDRAGRRAAARADVARIPGGGEVASG